MALTATDGKQTAASTNGVIRIRYWNNKTVRKSRSSGMEFNGLEEAPENVLYALREAVSNELMARRDERPDPAQHPR